MIPIKKTNTSVKNSCSEPLDESADDFQGEMAFREPKRLKLIVEQRPRKSSRTKLSKPSTSTSSTNSAKQRIAPTSELADVESAACLKNEKICVFCKTVVSTEEFYCHLLACIKNANDSTKSELKTASNMQDTVLPCPMCSKTFSSSIKRSAHLKKCGAEHGLSSDKLLVAVRLQEKQAKERASLGLPLQISVTAKTNEKVH